MTLYNTNCLESSGKQSSIVYNTPTGSLGQFCPLQDTLWHSKVGNHTSVFFLQFHSFPRPAAANGQSWEVWRVSGWVGRLCWWGRRGCCWLILYWRTDIQYSPSEKKKICPGAVLVFVCVCLHQWRSVPVRHLGLHSAHIRVGWTGNPFV